MADAEPRFLNVERVLEASMPRVSGGLFRYGILIFAVIVLASAYLSSLSPGWNTAIEFLSPLAMIAVVGIMIFFTRSVVEKRRAEMKQLEGVEELMQLRRWPEASMMLEGLLSQPMRSPQSRAQALIYLSSLLARYHRFEDSIAVQDHLLQMIRFDDGTDYSIRLGRAMAMLREDHLVDADRAINELRRLAQDRDPGGLALVELYRDVKTGHPEEAIAVFEQSMEGLKRGLGHRMGDAYALVARAYDLSGRQDQARQMYEKATLLQPAVELERRYPETASLRTKYAPVAPPAEYSAASGVAA